MGVEQGAIRVGIGGWSFKPWRGVFYPDGLAQRRELEYAATHLTAIEINATYYGSQKPESFAKWRAETPDGFVFSVKGPRFATNRRVLAEAGESVARFFDSGVAELGDKLGPIVWQFAPTKKFDPEDFAAFLDLLPATSGGVSLRHAVEVRHDSFACADFVALARKAGVAVVSAGDSDYPMIPDVTADFVYVRIMGTQARYTAGYAPKALEAWAERARDWSKGKIPAGLDAVAPAAKAGPRDVFLYVISGHKEANPAAAMALIELLG